MKGRGRWDREKVGSRKGSGRKALSKEHDCVSRATSKPRSRKSQVVRWVDGAVSNKRYEVKKIERARPFCFWRALSQSLNRSVLCVIS